MTSNRISTYTAWKRKNIEEMLESITPIVKTMVHELLKVRENYQDPNRELSVTTVTSALQQLHPPGQEPYGLIPETLPEGYLNAVTTILNDFKGSTGLTFVSADVALDHFGEEDIWGCIAHFSCPPLQQLFEARLGFPAEIAIKVYFDDYEILRVTLPDAGYMEMGDLLMLRASADEWWAEPLAWATFRANGC